MVLPARQLAVSLVYWALTPLYAPSVNRNCDIVANLMIPTGLKHVVEVVMNK